MQFSNGTASAFGIEQRAPWIGTALMLGVLAGCAVQLQQRRLWPANAYGMLIVVALSATVLVFRFSRAQTSNRLRWMRALLIAMLATFVTFGQVGIRSAAFAQTALSPGLEGSELELRGMIVAMPQLRDDGVRFRLEVDEARRAGQIVQVPPLVELAWYTRSLYGDEEQSSAQLPSLVAGQRWVFDVRLKAPHGSVNPFGFDYELAMWEQGVQATGYVRGADAAIALSGPRLVESTWAHPVERMRQGVRDAIFAKLVWSNAEIDPARQRAAGVVAALVVGDQRAIDRRDWDVFRITGVAHLVSISGLHITMFAWLASTLMGAAWRRIPALSLRIPAQSGGMVLGVLLATGYALFSGWGVPAQRTIFMLAVVVLLQLAGRRWPWPHRWLLACTLVLLWDPWAMLQAGFWLSFVAVGVLFASGDNQSPQSSENTKGLGALVQMYALLHLHSRQLVHQQWVVTLAVAPLTLLLFGQMSIVGLVVNMLAIPWVTLVVLPIAFAAVFWSALWTPALWAVQMFMTALQWFAALPLAQLTLPMTPLWAGVVAVLGGLWLALRPPWRLCLLALPCMLPALWWSHPRPLPGQFELLALDVGQGQSVLLRTAHHSLLYDAGPLYSASSDAGERVVVPVLRALDERLDMLLLSHRDSDHTGGAAAVLAQQKDSELRASIEADHPLARARPITPCVAGQSWNWDGVSFAVIHPQATHAAHLPSNAMSCVLRVSDANGVSALLVGDMEAPQERELLALNQVHPVQLLLVPHHGSKTSSSAAFLNALKPQIAVVQSGYRNRFGHPAPEVVARYRERHVALYETPWCGAVRWQSSQPQIVECERERSRRYWYHLAPGWGSHQG